MKNTVIIILTLFIGFASCKKDEDNEPQVNKDDLLCKTWQLDKEFINGEENQSMIKIDYKFNKDGTGSSVIYFGQAVTANFEWRWADNKESIEVMVINTKIKNGWNKANIIVLSENYLVLEQLIGDDQYRMEYTERIKS
mgnify:CR=1 FL=1